MPAGASATDQWAAENALARRRRVELVGWAVVVVAAVAVAFRSGEGDVRVGAAGVAVAAALTGWVRRPRPDPERWLRGAAGEQATAELLDRLSARRWAVLHDRRLPGTRANVDHLVIGPRGVWVLDSKAYRAPLRAGWRKVWAGDHLVDTGPVVWEAEIVADRLDVDVRALVVVHGSGLPRRGRRVGGVRVIPADALLHRLRRAGGRRYRLDRTAVDDLADRAEVLLPEA
jgi:Nuclease-related domain